MIGSRVTRRTAAVDRVPLSRSGHESFFDDAGPVSLTPERPGFLAAPLLVDLSDPRSAGRPKGLVAGPVRVILRDQTVADFDAVVPVPAEPFEYRTIDHVRHRLLELLGGHPKVALTMQGDYIRATPSGGGWRAAFTYGDWLLDNIADVNGNVWVDGALLIGPADLKGDIDDEPRWGEPDLALRTSPSSGEVPGVDRRFEGTRVPAAVQRTDLARFDSSASRSPGISFAAFDAWRRRQPAVAEFPPLVGEFTPLPGEPKFGVEEHSKPAPPKRVLRRDGRFEAVAKAFRRDFAIYKSVGAKIKSVKVYERGRMRKGRVDWASMTLELFWKAGPERTASVVRGEEFAVAESHSNGITFKYVDLLFGVNLDTGYPYGPRGHHSQLPNGIRAFCQIVDGPGPDNDDDATVAAGSVSDEAGGLP